MKLERKEKWERYFVEREYLSYSSSPEGSQSRPSQSHPYWISQDQPLSHLKLSTNIYIGICIGERFVRRCIQYATDIFLENAFLTHKGKFHCLCSSFSFNNILAILGLSMVKHYTANNFELNHEFFLGLNEITHSTIDRIHSIFRKCPTFTVYSMIHFNKIITEKNWSQKTTRINSVYM